MSLDRATETCFTTPMSNSQTHTKQRVNPIYFPHTLASLDMDANEVSAMWRINDGRRLIIECVNGRNLRVYDFDYH